LAHGIHFSDQEIARLGDAGVGVCHCPNSNMLLASGICHALELEQAGAPVGLGVDGSASNCAGNLIIETRQAMLLQRLRYGSARVTHHDALRWATAGGARVLGRPELGQLAVGKQADIAMFRLDELRFSGTADPVAALLLCGASEADHVLVGGRFVVKSGEVVGVDIEALRTEHGHLARALLDGA
jgi:8-oxoguanine deaminase